MYSETCQHYFNQALDLAEEMQTAMKLINNQAKIVKSPQGDVLKLSQTEQGVLVFQIKAPVYAMASLAYIKEQFDQGERVFDLADVCEVLQCPDTYRHQVQWVLDAVGKL